MKGCCEDNALKQKFYFYRVHTVEREYMNAWFAKQK